ncbi:MAG: sulfurtransferase [Candidatus Eremiobacteraeota bacterium]|nr:sulfurtransferase [Candidatus Eremiobacteraeota bacterium]
MSDLFVDLPWLQAHQNDPNVRLVDTRSKPHGVADVDAPSGARQYAAGHIPGAVHLDYADHLKDPATPHALRVAPPERFADVLGRSGIGDDTTVLAYDDGDVPYAARLVWMLRYYGHDDAHILGGGFKNYVAAGGEATTDVPTYPPRKFRPRIRPQLRASRDDVRAIAEGRSDAQLLETQRNKTYALRNDDIKGAVRLSGNELLDDAAGGRIAPRARLEALVAARNLDPHKRTIVTCGSGVSASGAYIALLEAGFTDLAVYDGSWMEWSHDRLPTVPKAAGKS